MLENLDAVLLARIQFAFTVSFHIIFPTLTIGLASFLAIMEWRWLKTGDKIYIEIYELWIKIFAIAFGMGVVSGVTLSYEIGTNWSIFSDKVANVIGPLLGLEVLTAFFLESSFLGIMLFGRRRVSPNMHLFATCVVAFGTLVSAFWIISANSWMQTPDGFRVGVDGRLYPTSWMAIIFNPSFLYRLLHMIIASYITTAFVVGGVGALYLHNKRHIPHARIMIIIAVIVVTIMTPIQMFIGHCHGLNVLKHQPAKIAAMEGQWETENSVGLKLFGLPDQNAEVTKYSIAIPNLTSLLLTHSLDGEVRGLKEWAREDRPPVAMVFWSFRVMVGMGLLMLATSLLSVLQYMRNLLFTSRWLHSIWIIMIPSGFIALLAGWFVTEIGRQPYVVYGVLRTAKAASPAIVGTQVLWSLLTFIVIYTLIFGAGISYIAQLVRMGVVSTKNTTRINATGKPQ